MSDQDWKLRTRSLTAPERETVVLMDDEADFALVTTWQRRVITKLEKNPAARRLAMLEDEHYERTEFGTVDDGAPVRSRAAGVGERADLRSPR